MIAQVQSQWTPKLLWLIVPSFSASTLWWYIADHTLNGRVGFTTASLPNLLGFLVFGVFAFGMWLGSFGLLGYISNHRTVRWVLAALVSLPLLLWFPLTFWTFIALGLTFIAVWLGSERMESDRHNRLAIRPQLSLSVFALSSTLIMIAVSLLYYQQLRGTNQTSEELANRLSGQTVTFAERFLPSVYKEYKPGQTIDELLLAQFPTADEILKEIKFSQFQNNPEGVQAEIRDQLAQRELDTEQFDVQAQASEAQVREELQHELERQRLVFLTETKDRLAEQIGIPVRGDEKVHDVLTRLVNKQFDQSVKQYVEAIPWLLAAALFFLLKIFTGLFILSVCWIGWGIFKLYRNLHILKIDHDMVPAEKVVWY